MYSQPHNDPWTLAAIESAYCAETFAELQSDIVEPPRPKPALPASTLQEITHDVPVITESVINWHTGEERMRSMVTLECYEAIKGELDRERTLRQKAQWDVAWLTATAVLAAFAAIVAIYRLVMR